MKRATNGGPPIHPGDCTGAALDGLGLAQAAFARTLGISPVRVSRLLRGDRWASRRATG